MIGQGLKIRSQELLLSADYTQLYGGLSLRIIKDLILYARGG